VKAYVAVFFSGSLVGAATGTAAQRLAGADRSSNKQNDNSWDDVEKQTDYSGKR
jgi:gas vesicle protein